MLRHPESSFHSSWRGRGYGKTDPGGSAASLLHHLGQSRVSRAAHFQKVNLSLMLPGKLCYQLIILLEDTHNGRPDRVLVTLEKVPDAQEVAIRIHSHGVTFAQSLSLL